MLKKFIQLEVFLPSSFISSPDGKGGRNRVKDQPSILIPQHGTQIAFLLSIGVGEE